VGVYNINEGFKTNKRKRMQIIDARLTETINGAEAFAEKLSEAQEILTSDFGVDEQIPVTAHVEYIGF
jgi:hypothetical protein